MKPTRKNSLTFRLLFVMVSIFLFPDTASAQDVNITVNVLPPYQLNFTDYRSRPNQLLIVLTNRTSNSLNIQLSGSIEGDNGVRLNTNPGTRSNQPVRLGPLETRSLSVVEIENLFDINQIQFQGISQQSIARNGILPEGNYTLCVWAQDYRTLTPLSAANPSGCSNIFPVNSLEAPVILKPFNEEEVSPLKPQNIVFTWTTPPNTPPGAYYIFNLVELLNDQQAPGAAIQTKTGINNFETRVFGNAFLFGPDQFPLTNNKRYAVQVTVVDPAGKSLYRNNGKSEVIVFNYGNTPIESSTPTTAQTAPPIKNKKPVTTNRISGKIGWAFLETEENFKSPVNQNSPQLNPSVTLPNVKPAIVIPINPSNPMPLVDYKSNIITVKDKTFLGGNNAGVNAVPANLKSNTGKYTFNNAGGNLQAPTLFVRNFLFPPAPSLSQYVLGNFDEPEYAIVSSSDKLSTNIHPMQVSLLLLGVKNKYQVNNNILQNNNTGNTKNNAGNVTATNPKPGKQPIVPEANNKPGKAVVNQQQAPPKQSNLPEGGITLSGIQYNGMDLIGSTRSNAAGEFNLDFISDDYLNNSKYSSFVLRVVTPQGFAKLEIDLSKSQLRDSNFDAGQLIAKAISHRLTLNATEEGKEDKKPTATSQNNNGGNKKSSNRNPNRTAQINNGINLGNINYEVEGNLKYEIYRKKSDVDRMPYLAWEGTLNGTLPAVTNIKGDSYYKVAGFSTKRTTARLFHTGTYLVRLMNNDTTKYAISNMEVVCNGKSEEWRPIDVSISKKILLQMPIINGNVSVNIADKELFGIPNVLVRVKFNKDDVDNKLPMLIYSIPGSFFSTAKNISLPLESSTYLAKNGPSVNTPDDDKNKTTANSAGKPLSFVQVNSNGKNQAVLVNQAAISSIATNYLVMPEYSTLTDSMGNYVISNLPVLLPGKTYEVVIGSLTQEYKGLPVSPSDKQISASIYKGQQATLNFLITPKVGLITATVVDENSVPLPYARLQFKGAPNPFEANEKGVFTTQYISGKQKLIISKEGYITKEVDVTVPEVADNKSGTPNSVGSGIPPSKQAGYLITQTQNIFTASGVSEAEAKKVIQNNSPQAAYQTALGFKNNNTFISSGVTQNAYGSNNLNLKNSFNYVSSGNGNVGTFSPVSANVNGTLAAGIAAAVGISPNATITAQSSLGNIGFLKEKFGRAKFKVVNKATGSPIANAEVKLFDTVYITNANGEAIHKGRGGEVTITVIPPQESLFAAAQISAEIIDNGTEPEIKIQLEKGVKVSGKVTSEGKQIADVNVVVNGSDFIKTITNSSGNYSIVMVAGSSVLKASRQGYIGKQKDISIQTTDIQNFDFDLEGGNGKNISTLLGFDIELESRTVQGTKESWSGKFINLTSKNNAFTAASDLKLNFSNVLITYDASGNAIPDGAGVKTDATSLPLKLFNWLPLKIEDANGIVVLKDNAVAGKGKIGGKINVDLTRLTEVRGLGLTQTIMPLLTLAGNTTAIDIFPFTSSSATAGNESFAFVGPQGNKLQLALYGFKVEVDLSKTTVSTDKINFKGKIFTPDLGIIQATSFEVEELIISKAFKIISSKIALNNTSLTIGNWQATLTNLSLGDNGFKLAGNIKVTLPASKESKVNFDNLSLGKDAIFGGAFSFPSGIDIFNAVQFKTGSTPFSFGKVGNSSVYRLSGSGNIHFNKFFTKDISIPMFQVQTDGKFNLSVPVNISQNLAFAKFSVTAITFNSVASVPYVGVTGDIKLDLPIIKLTAGDFKFYSSGRFDIGKIGASLTVPGFSGSAEVTLKENGFEGKGNLKFAALFGVDFGMHYYKLTNGYDFAAKFEAHIPVVIGLVTINSFGGGFAYNTETDYFEVSVTGSASFTGTGAVVLLNNLRLKVNSDMVITGGVDVRAFTLFDVAGAAITIDIPQAYFAVNVWADVEPIKGLARARVAGLLIISGKKGDSFAFLGAAIKVNVLSLIYADGKFAVGIGVSNATQRDETREFFDERDQALLGNNFTGIYASGSTKLGVDEDDAVGIDLGFVGVEAWYSTRTAAGFLLNFSNQTVVARLSGSVSYGLKVKFLRITVAGGKVGVCISVEGGYTPSRGVFFNGTAQGYISMNGGLCEPDDCNSVCKIAFVPAGIKLCAGAKVTVGFSQLPYYNNGTMHYSGFDFSFSLSGPKVKCD